MDVIHVDLLRCTILLYSHNSESIACYQDRFAHVFNWLFNLSMHFGFFLKLYYASCFSYRVFFKTVLCVMFHLLCIF